MRTSIPGYSKLVQHLHAFMERVYAATEGRTKRKVAKVLLEEHGWGPTELTPLETSKQALGKAVLLCHPDPLKRLCVFTDASESHWGAVHTQVPPEHMDRALDDQEHEPLMFLSGSFSGAAVHWAIVEKEAFAIVETCRPGGFFLYTDHRNLQYIFDPHSVSSFFLLRLLCSVPYHGILNYWIMSSGHSKSQWLIALSCLKKGIPLSSHTLEELLTNW